MDYELDSDDGDAGRSDDDANPDDNAKSDDDAEWYGEDEDAVAMVEDAQDSSMRRGRPFKCLGFATLLQKYQAFVDEVSSLLCLRPAEAEQLCFYYKWNMSSLQEEWFNDPERARERVGLSEAQPMQLKPMEPLICNVCFEAWSPESILALPCRHCFCKGCWRGYLENAITSGPLCTRTHCIHVGCKEAVLPDIFEALVSEELFAKYRRFAVSTFVDAKPTIKWCPAPGCSLALEYSGDDVRDVECSCGMQWCWACKEEVHRPVSCDVVKRWKLKNSSESENMTWILTYTKLCPSGTCKTPIEKNQGCMHMTCWKCKHEFCWMCLGKWSEHGSNSGGYYDCNAYQKGKAEGKFAAEEERRRTAQEMLDKYAHYYERYANHEKAEKIALAKLPSIKQDMTDLNEKRHIPEVELRFLKDAQLQIIQCRSVLKWTYALGYYWGDESKRVFFEHQQGNLEKTVDVMHELTEKPIKGLFPDDSTSGASKEFSLHKGKLVHLTNVVQTYFGNLMAEFEGDLANIHSLEEKQAAAEPSASAGTQKWMCKGCTFANKLTATRCEMCNKKRPERPDLVEVDAVGKSRASRR